MPNEGRKPTWYGWYSSKSYFAGSGYVEQTNLKGALCRITVFDPSAITSPTDWGDEECLGEFLKQGGDTACFPKSGAVNLKYTPGAFDDFPRRQLDEQGGRDA